MLRSTSSRPENCVQSSGDASGRRENSSMRAGISTVGTASARLVMMPSHRTRLNQRPAVCALRLVMVISKSFQVLDNRALLGVAQRGSVHVTFATVSRDGGVVAEEGAAAGGRSGGDE